MPKVMLNKLSLNHATVQPVKINYGVRKSKQLKLKNKPKTDIKKTTKVRACKNFILLFTMLTERTRQTINSRKYILKHTKAFYSVLKSYV